MKKIFQFRVKENTELLDAIIKVAVDNKIHSAVILSGVGALSKAVCRNLKWFPKEYPVKDEDRLFYQIEQPLELLSLSGWIASKKDSEAVEVHAHFSASTIEEGKVVSIGGHLTKGTVTGIKVVVALVILDKDNFYADFDMNTKSIDLFC
ncbi:MAG: PPC domain-containing DNA-binding protein [Eubacteriaceae bacterium]